MTDQQENDQLDVDRYVQALLSGSRFQARAVVLDWLDRDEAMLHLYTDLFQESLYRIGRLWQTNRISVAAEHVATAITESLIAEQFPRLFSVAQPRCHRRAVVSGVANESHQLGGRMVSDFLELQGWDSVFTGGNTPLEDLLNLIQAVQPDLVCLSLTLYLNMPELKITLESIRYHFPDQIVWVGGQAFQQNNGRLPVKDPEVVYVSGLQEISQWLWV